MCCTSVIDWDYAVDMDFTDKMQAGWTDVQVAELVCCGGFMGDARGCKVVGSSQSIVASISHFIKIPLYSSFVQVFPLHVKSLEIHSGQSSVHFCTLFNLVPEITVELTFCNREKSSGTSSGSENDGHRRQQRMCSCISPVVFLPSDGLLAVTSMVQQLQQNANCHQSCDCQSQWQCRWSRYAWTADDGGLSLM